MAGGQKFKNTRPSGNISWCHFDCITLTIFFHFLPIYILSALCGSAVIIKYEQCLRKTAGLARGRQPSFFILDFLPAGGAKN